jgi:CRISPR system Cascade subunit CasB
MSEESKMLKRIVKSKILRLAEAEGSWGKANLAKLRRGIGKEPGSVPELWEITLADLPDPESGNTTFPTRAEWAVHTAMTLYALHQQGKQQCMSQDGFSLGVSLRKLVKNEEDEQRIKRRFDAAATANSLDEFSYHLRGLVQLMKAQDVPLDYPSLAEEVYWFQFPGARNQIRLRWGRDFYKQIKEKAEGGEDSSAESARKGEQ